MLRLVPAASWKYLAQNTGNKLACYTLSIILRISTIKRWSLTHHTPATGSNFFGARRHNWEGGQSLSLSLSLLWPRKALQQPLTTLFARTKFDALTFSPLTVKHLRLGFRQTPRWCQTPWMPSNTLDAVKHLCDLKHFGCCQTLWCCQTPWMLSNTLVSSSI